jgi:hypothetical protein
MRTKRQPTIKTLLLLMAVVAVQCALLPRPVQRNDPWMHQYYLVGRWCMFVTGILFWSAQPLMIALCVRSTRRAGAIGLGFCFVWAFARFYSRSRFDMFSDSIGHWILSGILAGPFGCLAPIRVWWWDVNSEPMPTPLVVAANTAVLIIYTTTCLLTARSCRLREQPKTTSPAA